MAVGIVYFVHFQQQAEKAVRLPIPLSFSQQSAFHFWDMVEWSVMGDMG